MQSSVLELEYLKLVQTADETLGPYSVEHLPEADVWQFLQRTRFVLEGGEDLRCRRGTSQPGADPEHGDGARQPPAANPFH